MMKQWLKKQQETVEIVGLCLLFLLIFSPALIKQYKVEQRYGFSVSTPELGKKFISPCEHLVIMRVDSGGAFYNAGIQIFDVILFTPRSVPAFINKLKDSPRGTVLYINTIPKGFIARNCDELSEMEQVERKVVAP